jgi:hypothetical protein
MATTKGNEPIERKNLSINLKRQVLTEAGYRCAVPTCRQILTINIHHIYQIADGGGNDPDNLLALCPNCHSLYHTGVIHKDSIFVYKSILLSLSRAFDFESVNMLLFLYKISTTPDQEPPIITGDALLAYSGLFASGYVEFKPKTEDRHYVIPPDMPIDPGTPGYMSITMFNPPKRSAETMRDVLHLGYTLSITAKGKILVEAWQSGDREALRAALGVIPQPTE